MRSTASCAASCSLPYSQFSSRSPLLTDLWHAGPALLTAASNAALAVCSSGSPAGAVSDRYPTWFMKKMSLFHGGAVAVVEEKRNDEISAGGRARDTHVTAFRGADTAV